MVNVSTIAYDVAQASKNHFLQPVGLNHAQQLVVAALGYKTLASYQAHTNKVDDLDCLSDIVLDAGRVGIRVGELGLSCTVDEILSLIGNAFIFRVAGISIHADFSKLVECIREVERLEAFAEASVVRNSLIVNELNKLGVRAEKAIVYMSSMVGPGTLDSPKQTVLECKGGVYLDVPYGAALSGTVVAFEAQVEVELCGKQCFRRNLNVSKIYVLGDDDFTDFLRPPRKTLAQAIAEETGLTVDEAETIQDAEAISLETNDDFTYGYQFDFEDFASAEIAEKLETNIGGLTLMVDANFFDDIEEDYR